MADIKPGNPDTWIADQAAHDRWLEENGGVSIDDRSAIRNGRLEETRAFKKAQEPNGLVSLQKAIDWLEECDASKLDNRIAKLWHALSEDDSKFQLGGAVLPSAVIISPDSSQPVSPFEASDLAAARTSTMVRDRPRPLLERLWLQRNVLLQIFQQMPWPVPPWLDPPPLSKPARAKKSATGKYLLVTQYLEERFPGEVPDPAIEPRKLLIKDALAALPQLGGKLDEETMAKAIRSRNAMLKK
jgi:hypothetical protein